MAQSASDEAAGVFDGEAQTAAPAPAIDVETLHAKFGELTLENDFLSGALGKAGLLSAKRRSTLSTICRPAPGISLRRQPHVAGTSQC